ncbi:P-loop containing nucleoside triphosphate hydrolase protein [Thelephora terrestris]|uniref:P-loop containing nucleoside triphosphate hydrolase protein n=1 Tax=Thelephora terrestris TaxID=56493 RepID=A0A9P6HF49_9AGAM|nr:P-loop containing nucleoside triphosphate hydrolase protein [Thelephora terrestris]
MRRLSRTPTVFSRPPPDHPCIIFRRLSSSEAVNVNERFRSPVTEHIPRFDWRLRVSSPKPPLNTAIKVLEKRTQPPFPTDAYPYNAHIQKYKDHFLPLLSSERAQNEAVVKERLSSWSLDRLKREGYCITDTKAYWVDFQKAGRPVACFMLGPGIVFPAHVFEKGSPILISRADPLNDIPYRGNVVDHKPTQIKVALQVSFPELEEGCWRLDLGQSNIAYERMNAAISCLSHDVPAIEQAVGDGQKYMLHGTHLRHILLDSFSPTSESTHSTPLQRADEANYVSHETLDHGGRASAVSRGVFKDDMRIMSWAKRYLRPNPVRVEGDPVLPLNAPQVRAIATMIAEGMSLIQGPPGTGKTKTIIETIKLLKKNFAVVHPILVCTYTNVAVDNLVEGFVNAGLDPVRIGYGQIKSTLQEHSLEFKIQKHPLYPSYEVVSENLKKLEKELKRTRARIFERQEQRASFNEISRLKSYLGTLKVRQSKLHTKEQSLYLQMQTEVLASADVVCTTCISSGSWSLAGMDFPVVFLDEASMSTEPASLIPLMKGSRHVALIGDHKQLPPVITSPEAQSNGLGISLFERLTEEGTIPSVMLNIQYRMHPDISRFPSAEFYNFSLSDGTVDSAGNVVSFLDPPISSHLTANPATGNRPSLIFLDHAGSESAKDRSRVNWNEAHIVCSVVEDLLLHNKAIRGSDIGIITPYVAQVSLLNRLFNKNKENIERFKRVLGDQRAMQLASIEIKSVDGFEGREKDIIIFSTVRNNAMGHIGFLADRRRLNVGLTRAKRGLFIVGSIATLKMGRIDEGPENTLSADMHGKTGKGAGAWRRYVDFLSERGLVSELSGARLSKALYGNYEKAVNSYAGAGMTGEQQRRSWDIIALRSVKNNIVRQCI